MEGTTIVNKHSNYFIFFENAFLKLEIHDYGE